MSLERLRSPVHTPRTNLAAVACLERLAAEDVERTCLEASPYRAIQSIAHNLTLDDATNDNVWVVQASPAQPASYAHARDRLALGPGKKISAWPLRFRNESEHFEMPLLYLFRSESVFELRAAVFEAADRGILCNDVEVTSSRWPKSVQPAVPLWLANSPNCFPYDPSSGLEALAILRSAIKALYVDNKPGFFYMTLHDENGEVPIPSQAEVLDAYKGMYRLRVASDTNAPAVRLLGAGQALGKVVEAARLLREDWGIASEVWSCPSYSRLAREGYEVEHWNLLHPLSRKKTSHIQTCLGMEQSPVLAITGYGQHVADQIRGFVRARFIAMGADSHREANGFPSAQWIVATALKALGDEGALPMQHVEEALKRYALA